MAWELTIPGRLPGMNDIISEGRRSRYKSAAQKKGWTRSVAIMAQASGIPTQAGPVDLDIAWIEPNARRDPDNVSAGVKFILDGLVEAGVLEGDTRKHIGAIRHEFPEPDKKDPRVLVRLVPQEKTP